MSSRGAPARRGPTRTAGRSGSARGSAGSTSGSAAGARGGAGGPSGGARAEQGSARRSARALRAGVLAALVVVCLLSVLSPLATYVREQSSTAALTSQVDQATRDRASLDQAVARWDDPAFVAAQARARLHYVRPGETGYVVLDLPPEASPDPLATGGPDAAPGDGGAAPVPGGTTAATGAGGAGPWYDRLWRSVEVAGQR